MYKALVSFSGRVSMVKGEVRDINDPVVVADLLKAKYIVDLEAKKKAADNAAKKSTKRSSKKSSKKTSEGGVANE
jgi:hypothetical protein